MEIMLVLLCGTLMGAFNVGFFLLGYYLRGRKQNEEGVQLTKQNAEFVDEMIRWRNYGGKQ